MKQLIMKQRGVWGQNRAYGWFLLVTSWVLRLGGGLAAGVAAHEPLTIYSTASDPGYNGPAPWVVVIISIVVMILGLLVLGAALTMGRRARRHLVRVITSVSELRSGSYVLYLRPFRQDLAAAGIAPPQEVSPDMQILRSGRTHEERLARMFRTFGPMVTVGRPGEALPEGSGACRFYLRGDDWQDPVRGLIDGARVILLGAGPGPGTIWEYAEVLRRGRLHRLVVLVTNPDWYTRFRSLTSAELAGERPGLPSLPPPRRSARQAFYFRAMIYFGPGWQASLASFDQSAVDSLGSGRYVRRRLKPVLAHLRTAATLGPVLASGPTGPVPGPPPPQAVPPPHAEPSHAAPPPWPPASPVTFTNMPSRLTLALVRAAWIAAIIAGAVGCLIAWGRLGFGTGLLAYLAYFVLGFFGTAIIMARVTRWRTLVIDSAGFTVTVVTLREDRHPSAQARWDQVVRIGTFGRPGQPVLCAWITVAGFNPSRLVRLCPTGSPDFPVEAIVAAIRGFGPLVAIDPPYGPPRS